jgi:hypothetical protein
MVSAEVIPFLILDFEYSAVFGNIRYIKLVGLRLIEESTTPEFFYQTDIVTVLIL